MTGADVEIGQASQVVDCPSLIHIVNEDLTTKSFLSGSCRHMPTKDLKEHYRTRITFHIV